MKGRIFFMALLATILVSALSIEVLAQEESTAVETAVAELVAAEPAVAEPPRKLSKMDKLKRKIRGYDKPEPCEENCASTEDSLALPDEPGIRVHTCESGNCSCAGAKDCVDMKRICTPNTLTCNDYGCTCAEKPDEGGDGG
jgi:hypothetical protein